VAVDHPERTALAHFAAAMSGTPPWVDRLMRLRNRVVRRLGLKDLGDMAAESLRQLDADPGAPPPKPGERVGIFTLRSCRDDEVLVEDDDRHLRVVLSVRRQAADAAVPARVVVTTVVHVHNWLGHVYMLPVAPMHRLIAPAVLSRINGG
jgi:hypothetical protein